MAAAMSEIETQDVLGELKKVPGTIESYHVLATFKFYREAKNGHTQEVHVEVLDAGAEVRSDLRFTCSAKADDGSGVAGNADASVQKALANVEWSLLDLDL